MHDQPIIYEVKVGDTLSSIATQMGMSESELKDFHNTHCESMGLLWFNGFFGVQKIIIPKNHKSADQKRKELKPYLPSTALSEFFLAEKYSVKENFSKSFEEKIEIIYNVSLELQKKNDKNFAAKLNRHNVKDNEEKPDDKMSSLAIACFEAISPIEINLQTNGKASGLTNHKDLIKNFKSRRNDIQDFHTGEINKKYLDKFEYLISNENDLFKQLQSTLLYQTIFPNLEWFYKENIWTENFYLTPNSFPVKCEMEIEFDSEDSEVLQTTITGKCIEKCSLQELLRGIRTPENEDNEQNSVGEILLKYTTDKKSKNLIHAESSITLWYDDGEIYQRQGLTLN